MKPSLATALIISVVAAVIAIIAFMAARYIDVLPSSTSSGVTPAKDYITTIVVAAIGGLLLAMLVLLVPDRWKKIESEVLSLREGQNKALDDLRKRADERISEKLDSASRQAQSILDHVTGLSDRFPWIKGISEVGFEPNSNSCQLVLRNAAKLVATGQGMLAHEYLYSWTRDTKKGELPLVGSSYDFLKMAAFAQLVLADEYLSMLLVSVGYHSRAHQLLLGPAHLRALSRNGMIADSIDVAESIRQRALPTWRERLRQTWYAARRFGKPTVRLIPPTAEDCAALALFFGAVGDRQEFTSALAVAERLVVTPRDGLMVHFAKAEGLATLGDLNAAAEIAKSLSAEHATSEGVAHEFVWVLRRCALTDHATELLDSISEHARERVRMDFGVEEDDDDTQAQERVPEHPATLRSALIDVQNSLEPSRAVDQTAPAIVQNPEGPARG